MSLYLSMPLWLIGGFLLGAGGSVCFRPIADTQQIRKTRPRAGFSFLPSAAPYAILRRFNHPNRPSRSLSALPASSPNPTPAAASAIDSEESATVQNLRVRTGNGYHGTRIRTPSAAASDCSGFLRQSHAVRRLRTFSALAVFGRLGSLYLCNKNVRTNGGRRTAAVRVCWRSLRKM